MRFWSLIRQEWAAAGQRVREKQAARDEGQGAQCQAAAAFLKERATWNYDIEAAHDLQAPHLSASAAYVIGLLPGFAQAVTSALTNKYGIPEGHIKIYDVYHGERHPLILVVEGRENLRKLASAGMHMRCTHPIDTQARATGEKLLHLRN